MERVTASQVQEAVMRAGVLFWTLRTCSVCNAPLDYLFLSNGVLFDASCDCTRFRSVPRPSSYEDVAEQLNQQVPEERARMWAEMLRLPA